MCHSFDIDATDQTASTFHEEFAVPLGRRRQPDFGLDFRIGRRSESDGDSALSCGLYCGGDGRQARHVGTTCLREQWGREKKEEQAHVHKLTLLHINIRDLNERLFANLNRCLAGWRRNVREAIQ